MKSASEHEEGWRQLRAVRRRSGLYLLGMLLCWVGYIPAIGYLGAPGAIVFCALFATFAMLSTRTLGRAICPSCGDPFYGAESRRRAIFAQACRSCRTGIGAVPPELLRARLQPLAERRALEFVHPRVLEGPLRGVRVTVEQPERGAPRTVLEADAQDLSPAGVAALRARVATKVAGARVAMTHARARIELPGTENDAHVVGDVLDDLAEACGARTEPYRG